MNNTRGKNILTFMINIGTHSAIAYSNIHLLLPSRMSIIQFRIIVFPIPIPFFFRFQEHSRAGKWHMQFHLFHLEYSGPENIQRYS